MTHKNWRKKVARVDKRGIKIEKKIKKYGVAINKLKDKLREVGDAEKSLRDSEPGG